MDIRPNFDYTRLAQPERNHARLYTDPAIFAEEMEKIFRRSWVYVAHESEIPNPGDYLTTYVAWRRSCRNRPN
ncbi:MAG: hypothetical protein EPN68_02175 [Rhodanobacter sp.]|nr:MAG: hypothetical protein EPN68_02175 [Rhodanobacter sp.]